MSLKIDKVQLEIIMKADSARAEMLKLDDEAKRIQKSMKGLKKDSEEYIRKNEELSKVKLKMQELRNQIGLTGMTMRELQQRSKELQLQLRNLDPRSPRYAEYRAELDRINGRMRELRGGAQQTETSLSRLANGFNKYFAIGAAAIASITGLSMTFRKLAEDVAHMDDVYSDVMKTTGMTRDQVLALNEDLKKIDTRTGRESLNNLARDAGKLGISGTKNILDFVDAGNQINVALGEDLGEDAIKNIGKMVGVFQSSTEQLKGVGLKEQMLAVGSAVNQLGASSTASEQYLVSFAGRMGGVSKQAKISMADILGYASALDQDMQQVEMSATALQTFIMKMMGDPAKFAKLAGLEVREFTNLLNTDTNAAMKEILRTLNDKGGFQALIPIFQEMGLDGARATGVLSAMAGSIDKIDEAQRVANQSMSEGVSITNEYNIKNNNLAAQLEKAKKRFQEQALELGQSLNPILLKSTKATTYLIQALVELPKAIKENKGLIFTLAAVLSIYTVAVNGARIATLLQIAAEKLRLFWSKAVTAGTLVQIAVTGYLTGATRAATVATKALFQMLRLNPYVAVGIAIGAIVIGLYKLVSGTKSLSAEQKALIEVQEQLNSEMSRESINLDVYKKRLLETEPNSKERIRLVKELTEIYPDLLSNIDAESASIAELSSTMTEYMSNLENNIKLKVLYSKISEKISSLEGEKDYDQRQIIKRQIDELKKQYEYQLLVVSYGEKNAELVSQRSELEKKQRALGVIEETQSFEVFSQNWKIRNQRQNILYKNKKAESDALNAAYNDYLNQNNNIKKDLTDTANKLKQIDKIIDGGVVKKTKNKPDLDPTSTPIDVTKEDPFNNELKVLEDNNKKWQLKTMELRRQEKITQEIYDSEALESQLRFLENKRRLQEKYGISTIDTEIEISNLKKNIAKTSDDAILDLTKTNQEAGLKAIESGEKNKQAMLDEAYADQLISQRDYNIESKKLTRDGIEARLAISEATLKSLMSAEFQSEDTRKKAIETQKAEIDKLKEELRKAGIDLKGLLVDDAVDVGEQMQKIFGSAFASVGDLFTNFTNSLNALKKGDLKSWEDWAGEINEIVQSAITVATQINDQYFEYKAASLEADKQRELTNAGDSAEQREVINKKYAQKELDLKKKQSSADSALNIAKALSAGAVAIIKAFELGPIGGAIAAALIGTMTGLQVGTIIKQNAAIQATTLDSSFTGGSPATPEPKGTLVAQAADGRYDVVGAQDNQLYRNVPYGGNARTGLVTTPTLYGERGTELVIDAPTLSRLNMKVPNFNSFVLANRVNQRADGNYAPAQSGAASAGSNTVMLTMIATLQKNNELLDYLKTHGVEAFMLYDKAQQQQRIYEESIKKGSK